MDQGLNGKQGTDAFIYLDDIVIYSSSLGKHELKLERLMKRLWEAWLKLQPDKCEFLRPEVVYLEHIISKEGVRPDNKKLVDVWEFPRPQNIKSARKFLGLAGYYRRFIKGFSDIAKPLMSLTKKDVPVNWGEPTNRIRKSKRQTLWRICIAVSWFYTTIYCNNRCIRNSSEGHSNSGWTRKR